VIVSRCSTWMTSRHPADRSANVCNRPGNKTLTLERPTT
jgi:hypothetical protein